MCFTKINNTQLYLTIISYLEKEKFYLVKYYNIADPNPEMLLDITFGNTNI